MRRRSYRYLAALSLLPLAAGCVQATRHSNTMVFGTNTSVGVKVGTNTGETPQILIGYDRQEAVIMPLLANTGEHSANGNLLSPCDPAEDYDGDDDALHPCLFVASRTDGQNRSSQDSYSVLASFGAEISADSTGGKGSVGLAQYFSTGLAAQLLAANGGAAVVAVGKAAEDAAKNPNNAQTTAAVLGADTFAPGAGKQNMEGRTILLSKIAEMSDADVRSKLPGVIGSLSLSPRQKGAFDLACTGGSSTRETCLNFINLNKQLIEGFSPAKANAL